MAYNISVTCDFCGEGLFSYKNECVNITRAAQIARKNGWKIKDGEWYCKDCLRKITPPPERPDVEDT